MTYTGIPLGLLGLPWSDLTEKAWNQTFNASQVTFHQVYNLATTVATHDSCT